MSQSFRMCDSFTAAGLQKQVQTLLDIGYRLRGDMQMVALAPTSRGVSSARYSQALTKEYS